MDEKLDRDKGTSAQLITFVKDRPGHDKRYAIDASKIKTELGWEPSWFGASEFDGKLVGGIKEFQSEHDLFFIGQVRVWTGEVDGAGPAHIVFSGSGVWGGIWKVLQDRAICSFQKFKRIEKHSTLKTWFIGCPERPAQFKRHKKAARRLHDFRMAAD